VNIPAIGPKTALRVVRILARPRRVWELFADKRARLVGGPIKFSRTVKSLRTSPINDRFVKHSRRDRSSESNSIETENEC